MYFSMQHRRGGGQEALSFLSIGTIGTGAMISENDGSRSLFHRLSFTLAARTHKGHGEETEILHSSLLLSSMGRTDEIEKL